MLDQRSIDERVANAPADKRVALRATLEGLENRTDSQRFAAMDERTVRAIKDRERKHSADTGATALPTSVGKVKITGRRAGREDGMHIVILADAPQGDSRDGLRVRKMRAAKAPSYAPNGTRQDARNGVRDMSIVSHRPAKAEPAERAPKVKAWHVEVLDAAHAASVENWQDHYLASRQVMAHAEASGNDRLRRHALTIMRLLRSKFGPVPTPPNVKPPRQDSAEEFRTVSGQRRVIFN